MQPVQGGGGGGAGRALGGGGGPASTGTGTGGASQQQQLQEMQQRLQQQLVQQAQYQQQQAANGGAATTGGATQSNMMASQQLNAGGLQQQRGMNNTTALALMQQQQLQQHQAANPNSSGTASSIYGNLAALQQQGTIRQNSNHNMLLSSTGATGATTTMDASTGSSARLMAMAAAGMPQQQQQHSSSKVDHLMDASNASSAATMQSMQALFQQQQQQQINPIHQMGGGGLQGPPQLQQQTSQQSMFGGSQRSIGSASTGNQQQQLMGVGGVNSSQSAQQLMLQQQLSALQQQMQQQQQAQQTAHAAPGGVTNGGGLHASGASNISLPSAAAAAAAAMGIQGNAAAAAMLQGGGGVGANVSTANILQARQQQLMQQIQQQQRAAAAAAVTNGGGGSSSSGLQQQQNSMRQTSASLLQRQQSSGNQSQRSNSASAGLSNNPISMATLMGGSARGVGGTGGNTAASNLALQAQSAAALVGRGPLNEQQLRLYQQNLLRSGGSSSSSGNNAAAQQSSSMAAGGGGGVDATTATARSLQQQQRSSAKMTTSDHGSNNGHQQQQPRDAFGSGTMGSSGNNRLQQHQSAAGVGPLGDSSSRSHHSGGASQQQQQSRGLPPPQLATGQQGNNISGHPQQQQQQQQQTSQAKNFLDGNFAGGWQSNEDLPDRRKVIFSILEVIRQMRPDASDMSSKLPRMAKSLEEHLYRSAQTKEQYLDMKTLKVRLQSVANGLDIHRTSSGTSIHSSDAGQQRSQSVGLAGGQPNAQWGNPATAAPQSNNVQFSGRNVGVGGIPSSLHGNQANGAQQLGNLNASNLANLQQQRRMATGQVNNSINAPGSTTSQDQLGGSWNSGNTDNSGDFRNAMALGGSSQQQGVASTASAQQNPPHDHLAASQSSMSAMQGVSAWDRTQSLLANALGSNSSGTSKVINPDYPNTPKYQDPEAAQKKKVIMQQQQRLLLLRHASKCKAGPACTTKFCNQMVTLWRHMKTCRDKNCKTSHCLSSRCVLNHYRICKSQGKTATCEVCGPVMAQIRLQGRDDGSSDPLARDQTPTPGPPQPQGQMIVNASGQSQTSSLATNLMASQQLAPNAAMQAQMAATLSGIGGPGQHHAAMLSASANQQMAAINPSIGMPNVPGSTGSVGSQQSSSEQTQLQQLQQHQLKMQGQLESLKELQRQQQQLLDQQNRLQEQSQLISDPDSPSAHELQQQQMLLDELQKRCQQQQIRLQQEIEVQSNAVSVSQAQAQQQQQEQQQQFQQAQQQQAQIPDAAALPSNSLSDQSGETGKKKRRSSIEGKGRRSGKGERSGKGKSLKLSQARRLSGASQSDASVKRKSTSAPAPKERVQKKAKPPPKSEIPTPSVEDQNSSLIAFMTKENIESHLESLDKKIRMSSRTVTHKCMPVVNQLIEDKFGWVFHDPVDPVALGLPDYFDVVKTPMHLELVKKKLENAIYPSMDLFARDVRLVFENAILYNGETSEVGELAQTMIEKFDVLYKDLVEGVESSQQQLEMNGEACSLCGAQKRKFEPTVLYCQGKCGMQRIKRGATYYTDRTKSNHWCDSCYELLDAADPIILDDGSEIQKKELQEFKNDALPEEAWVNCDGCQSWVHQICALFNGRTNKSNARYTCPQCYLRKGDEIGFPIADKKFAKGAMDLPSSKMSSAIENGLNDALEKAYELRSKELGVPLEEVERANGLTVRVISNVEKKQLTGEEMYERYSGSGCPSEFPVHSKCIGLFQNIHGVDTLLFALYVYEYGQDCPAPNKRRVYISYLDSVQYFEPKVYRTTAYHAILMEYLRYVKSRGFHTAHIWSCPPAPGDDYIFYCHPSHQLTPREDMLRAWYHQMIDKAKAQGIVIRSTTLYDEYFTKDGVDTVPVPRDDPTCLPYFEGDYIPGEIETIIRQLRADDTKNAASGDEVMNRLRHNIGKMKDNFIVVHLRNRRFAAAVERGEDVSKWTEDSDEELIRSKRAKISGKESGNHEKTKNGDASGEAKGETQKAEADETKTEDESGKDKDIASVVSGHMASLDRKRTVVADTSDEDPTVESEMFESRQQFLNYCQTNHCQYDELRRAKHSTLMVLFQLHNPSAPKFLQQCSACYRDMTHGFRYHCNDCSNFDLCEDCYKPVTTGLWAQKDERFAHDQSHTFKAIDMEATEETQKSPEERQKALKDHIELLEHAGTCSGPPDCSLQNCERMKKLFGHVRSCDIKPKSGCKICTRLLSLCVMHARLCPVRGECPIPFCDRIRERNLRVRRQQQLMDDRRRQAQNELYHAGGTSS